LERAKGSKDDGLSSDSPRVNSLAQGEIGADGPDDRGLARQPDAAAQAVKALDSSAVRAHQVADTEGFQLVACPIDLLVRAAKRWMPPTTAKAGRWSK